MNTDRNKQADTEKKQKQQQHEVSPYSRGKDLNPTQNPKQNPDDFSESMKDQDRADNEGGRAQEKHPSGTPGSGAF